jgi:hypothetical protein
MGFGFSSSVSIRVHPWLILFNCAEAGGVRGMKTGTEARRHRGTEWGGRKGGIE